MSWQTRASDAVLQSQEVWRLTKTVESPGDIFEQDVSALAVAIGPDSDIAKVKITYYDPVSDSRAKLSEGVVGIDSPFVGRVDALLATQIPGSQKDPLPAFPARVLFSLDNIVDADFPILGRSKPDDSNVLRAPTKIDLVSYVADPRGVVPQRRPNKQIDFDTLPVIGNDPTNSINFVVPYFGRRSASIYCTAIPNQALPAQNLSATLLGYSINEGESPNVVLGFSTNFNETLASTGGPGSFQVWTSFKINANDHGLWDYLVLSIEGYDAGYTYDPGDFRVQFNVSDEG